MTTPSSRSSRSRALHARDAGLRRVSFLTRVVVVGSVTAAGAFTALAAWAQPGRNRVLTRSSRQPLSATLPSSGAAPIVTPTSSNPAAVAPEDDGGDANSPTTLAPPTTLPDPGYANGGYANGGYANSGATVVSGAS